MLQDANITMKDGTHYSGPLWEVNDQEGWIRLSYNYEEGVEAPNRIYLRDVETAVWEDQMVHPGVYEDVDLLARARDRGWDG